MIELEVAVVGLRMRHPARGGRKIARRLLTLEGMMIAPSAVTAVLHRYGSILPRATEAATARERLEHAEPSQIRQIDFKG